MTLWKIGNALVRAAHVEIAKAKLADETDNPEYLTMGAEIVREQGPEEIVMHSNSSSTPRKRTKKANIA